MQEARIERHSKKLYEASINIAKHKKHHKGGNTDTQAHNCPNYNRGNTQGNKTRYPHAGNYPGNCALNRGGELVGTQAIMVNLNIKYVKRWTYNLALLASL